MQVGSVMLNVLFVHHVTVTCLRITVSWHFQRVLLNRELQWNRSVMCSNPCHFDMRHANQGHAGAATHALQTTPIKLFNDMLILCDAACILDSLFNFLYFLWFCTYMLFCFAGVQRISLVTFVSIEYVELITINVSKSIHFCLPNTEKLQYIYTLIASKIFSIKVQYYLSELNWRVTVLLCLIAWYVPFSPRTHMADSQQRAKGTQWSC